MAPDPSTSNYGAGLLPQGLRPRPRPQVDYPDDVDPTTKADTDKALDKIWEMLGGGQPAHTGKGKDAPNGDHSQTPGTGKHQEGAAKAKERAEKNRQAMDEAAKLVETILAEAAVDQEASKAAVEQMIADLNVKIATLKPVSDTAQGQSQIRTELINTLKRAQTAVREATARAKDKGNNMSNQDGDNPGAPGANNNSPGNTNGDSSSKGDNPPGDADNSGSPGNTNTGSGDDSSRSGDDDQKKAKSPYDDPMNPMNPMSPFSPMNPMSPFNSMGNGLNNGLNGLTNPLGNLTNPLTNPGAPGDTTRPSPLDNTGTPTPAPVDNNGSPTSNTPVNTTTPPPPAQQTGDQGGAQPNADDDPNKPDGDPKHQNTTGQGDPVQPGDRSVKLPNGTTSEAPNAQAAQAVRNALADKDMAGDAARTAYAGTGVDLPSDGKDLGKPVEDPADLRAGDIAQWGDHTRIIAGPGLVVEGGEVKPLEEVMNNSNADDFKGFYRPTESAADPTTHLPPPPPPANHNPTSSEHTQTPQSQDEPDDEGPPPGATPGKPDPNMDGVPNTDHASWTPTPWERLNT